MVPRRPEARGLVALMLRSMTDGAQSLPLGMDELSFSHALEAVGVQAGIGGYVAAFSQVPAQMRDCMIEMIVGPDAPAAKTSLMHTLLSKMTADPLRSAFFAMCFQVATDLHDEDRTILRILETETQFQIKLRNDVAHADWQVGIHHRTTGKLVPAEARRMKVDRQAGAQHVVLPFTAEFLGYEASRVFELATCCSVAAATCRDQVNGPYLRPSDALEWFHDESAGRRRVRLIPKVLDALLQQESPPAT